MVQTSFPPRKVMFCKVAKLHQGYVENLMLSDMLFGTFPQKTSKNIINDSVYKVSATDFPFSEMQFSHWKVTFFDVAKWHQDSLRNLMVFCMILSHFPGNAPKSLHKRQCL